MGAVILGCVMALMVLITLYLVGSMMRSIGDKRRPNMKIWKNFGLSLGFCTLFLLSWVGRRPRSGRVSRTSSAITVNPWKWGTS